MVDETDCKAFLASHPYRFKDIGPKSKPYEVALAYQAKYGAIPEGNAFVLKALGDPAQFRDSDPLPDGPDWAVVPQIIKDAVAFQSSPNRYRITNVEPGSKIGTYTIGTVDHPQAGPVNDMQRRNRVTMQLADLDPSSGDALLEVNASLAMLDCITSTLHKGDNFITLDDNTKLTPRELQDLVEDAKQADRMGVLHTCFNTTSLMNLAGTRGSDGNKVLADLIATDLTTFLKRDQRKLQESQHDGVNSDKGKNKKSY